MSERVAVITPVRDGAATLPTLASALTRQGVNLGSLSWVVADDGSSDDSVKVARCAARSRDLRLTLVSTDGAEGPGPARNLAVQAALADPDVKWLTFVDADDALEPGALAAWWARASARNADLLLTAPPRSIVGRMRANLGESARTLGSADLWDGETLRLWGVYGKFVHRDVAANAAFPAVMETEDLTYYLELFDHARSVVWAPDLPRYVYPEAARSGVLRAPRLPLGDVGEPGGGAGAPGRAGAESTRSAARGRTGDRHGGGDHDARGGAGVARGVVHAGTGARRGASRVRLGVARRV